MTDVAPTRIEFDGEVSDYPRLTSKLLALSVEQDDYDLAKLEWRITGRVWRKSIVSNPTIAEHPCGHPNRCLCGHDIVYHFEIENTKNGVLEIVGSTCINNWMVLRHMTETLKIDASTITEEMIEEWKTITVQGLIKDAWWDDEGEEFTKLFNEIKDLDLRVNVREQKGKKYWDETLKMRRPVTKIRKTGSGRYGARDYKMASIVWRWNHPDNKRNQQSTRGYPNERLLNDMALFDAFIDEHIATIAAEDKMVDDRMEYLNNISLKNKDKLRNISDSNREEAYFIRRCEYLGWPHFTPDDASNAWERAFLTDMRRNFLNNYDLTEKQAETLNNILYRPKKEATDRQKSYLLRNGYTGDVDSLSMDDASMIIQEIDNKKDKEE